MKKKEKNTLKQKIHSFFSLSYVLLKIKIFKTLNKNGYFLLMTPQHGNLGDHAIALSTKILLKSNNKKFIELTDYQIQNLFNKNRIAVFNKYKLLICGGGNIGPLYPNLEKLFKEIISKNPESKIIVLPSSINAPTKKGHQHYINRNKDIYNSHQNLTLYLRDDNSLKQLKDLKCIKKVFPDTAMSLKYNFSKECIGCLLVLRNDKESCFTKKEKIEIFENCKSIFNKVTLGETNSNVIIYKWQRKRKLTNYLKWFSSYNVIVTDKLHALIFATILKRKCIVFDSNNHKIKSYMQWLNKIPYIIQINTIKELSPAWNKIENTKCDFDNSTIIKQLNKMVESL